jgi:hypothetical protein
MAVNFECVDICILSADYQVSKQTSGRLTFQVLDEQNNLLIRIKDASNWIGAEPVPEISVYKNSDCARYGRQAYLIASQNDSSYIIFFDTLVELHRFESLLSDFRNGRKKSVFKQVRSCSFFRTD